MYKVMLIDDEKFIRKSLRNRINWERLGLHVEAEAENGVEALQMLGQIKPEIVFVDIRMPLMDGLSFIREARKQYSNIHYIITSAYDDFEYARQAISLGVDDYIMKPVKVPEVESLLEKTVHKITEEEISKQLKEKMLAEGMTAATQGKKVAAIAFYVEEADGIELIIHSGLQEILNQEKQVNIYRLREYSCTDCYVYLLSGEELEEHWLFEAAAQIWAMLREKEGTATWSEILPKSEIKAAARRCIRLLKTKIFYPERKILTKISFGKENEKAEEEQLNQIRHVLGGIYRQLPNGNYTAIRGELMLLPDLIVSRNNRIVMIESYIMELVMVLERFAQQEMDELETDIIFRHVREKDYLLRYRTEEELRASLKEMIRCVCEIRDKGERKELITDIKEYIRNNYSENLSAADISGVFFLNTSYLSTLFKEKTGMTMTTYIEAVRMEKAKQLLLNRELSITEVAAYTGYSDPNYFSKVFRKYTSMSPRRYREEAEEDSE